MNTGTLWRPSVPLRSRYSKRFHDELGTGMYQEKQKQGLKPGRDDDSSAPASQSPEESALSHPTTTTPPPPPPRKRLFTKRREEQQRREERERLAAAADHSSEPKDGITRDTTTTTTTSSSSSSANTGPSSTGNSEMADGQRSIRSSGASTTTTGTTSGDQQHQEQQGQREAETLTKDLEELRQLEQDEGVEEPAEAGAGAVHTPPAGPSTNVSSSGTSRSEVIQDGGASMATKTTTSTVKEQSRSSSSIAVDQTTPPLTDSHQRAAEPSPRVNTFCDLCPHLRFTTFEQAETHVIEMHRDHVPDYQRLRTVVHQLRATDVWAAVKKQRHQDGLFTRCGDRVLEEGRRKDPGPERMLEAHRAREQLEAVVQQWHPTAKVYIFGSSVTFGIWDGMGDIDFTVVDEAQLRAGTWPPPERNAVRSITELLRRAGFSYVNLEPISHARVPIIKHHASFPIRLEPSTVRRWLLEEAGGESASSAVQSSGSSGSSRSNGQEDGPGETAADVDLEKELMDGLESRLEAEDVIARSVRYVLNAPAEWEDRLLLEASIREAVGSASVQQIWWNRTRDLMNVTLDSTTNAIRAATCPLAVVSPTLRARIQPLHEDCRPELYGIDFDLSFRVFGIRNSQLLRRYFMQHPCARPGAMILKEWSKRSGVNNSVNGFLTSYAVAILWLYFLLQKGVVQFVDPVKDVPASLEGCPKNPLYVPMVDPNWSREERSAYAAQAGELLVEFFYFYAVEFNWQDHVVSLNRPGVTTKASLGWLEEDEHVYHHAVPAATGGSSNLSGGETTTTTTTTVSAHRRHTVRYNFCIEDPYEENLNLGRHMGLTKTLRVQSEFYRGLLSLLKEGEKESCVFPPSTDTSSDSHNHNEKRNDSDNAEAEEGEEGEVGTRGVVASTSSPAPPRSLAQRVLYRLMAITIREVGQSRRAHAEQLHSRGVSETAATAAAAAATSWMPSRGEVVASVRTPTAPKPLTQQVVEEEGQSVEETKDIGSPCVDAIQDEDGAVEGGRRPEVPTAPNGWAGLPQETLRAVMEAKAKTELKIALKAWNWQQLIHRLGYKLHHGHVFPRREVGLARTRSPPPPPPQGVIPTPHAREVMHDDQVKTTSGAGSNVSSSSTSGTPEVPAGPSAAVCGLPSTGEALRHLSARGLSEEMQIHVSEGFLKLTPEWVAWSAPWAAGAQGVTSTPSPSASVDMAADTSTATSDTAAALKSGNVERGTAVGEKVPNISPGAVTGGGAGGALRSTPPRLQQALLWRQRTYESHHRVLSTWTMDTLLAAQRFSCPGGCRNLQTTSSLQHQWALIGKTGPWRPPLRSCSRLLLRLAKRTW